MPEDQPCTIEIVGRHLDRDAVTRQGLDTIFFIRPAVPGDDDMPVLELHTELGVGQNLDDHTLEFERFFLRHGLPQETFRLVAEVLPLRSVSSS